MLNVGYDNELLCITVLVSFPSPNLVPFVFGARFYPSESLHHHHQMWSIGRGQPICPSGGCGGEYGCYGGGETIKMAL